MRFFLPMILVLIGLQAFANDGASSDPAGGLILKKQEKVSIKKEVLTMSYYTVQVEYEFENSSDQDIETYVQFPMPVQAPIGGGEEADLETMIKSFELTIDGKKSAFRRTFNVYGKDLKLNLFGELERQHLPHDNYAGAQRRLRKLSKTALQKLESLGLINKRNENYEPFWRNQLVLYWKMKFPAKKVVKVKHEYMPKNGSEQNGRDFFESSCADEGTQKAILKMWERNESKTPHSFFYQRVSITDYILTTANTWDGPIKDFKLVLKKENDRKAEDLIISTCFPGVKKVSEKQFEAHITNFKPDKELSVFFYSAAP